MRQLTLALQFKGSGAPGSDGKLHAKSSASSQTLRTVLDAAGVRFAVESIDGDRASFESIVEVSGDGSFIESGTISYGRAGSVAFKTLGRGVLGTSPIDGLQRGAVIWEVTRGDGGLAGASGLITSNFAVDASGQVTDNHFAVLFVRD